VRALKSELLEKIFFKGQAAGIGWWTFFYVAAFFVVNDPVEFRITYHLDYEVTGPASVLFNVAVAQNSKGRTGHGLPHGAFSKELESSQSCGRASFRVQ
jgi:hypothetical protein